MAREFYARSKNNASGVGIDSRPNRPRTGGKPGRGYYTGGPGDGMRRLILFDIDGTLVLCGSQGRSLFEAALIETFGTAGNLGAVDFAGKTDPGIALEALTVAGFPPAAVLAGLPRAKASYAARLAQGLDRAQMRLLPGVPEVL